MVRYCKGACAVLTAPTIGCKYSKGYKWCRTCQRYLTLDGYRCPCCSGLVRLSKRRANKILVEA